MPKTASKNTETPANLNSTAYRIFKVLQWLVEAPLNVDEINARLKADPAVGKALSPDSLWLYINTLRALGCDIQRPSKRNGFRYTLTGHAFGMGASEEDVQMLADVRRMGEENAIDWHDILALDSLFKMLLADVPGLAERYFKQCRTVDYTPFAETIAMAEDAVGQKQLLSVTYMSPRNGKETFFLLPDGLTYRNGALYLNGERHPVRNDLTLLRMDRILALAPANKPEIVTALNAHRNSMSDIALKIYPPEKDVLNTEQPFGLGENARWLSDENAIAVRLKTRDWFTLKQKILEAGYPVAVEKPVALKDELLRTVKEMQQLYGDESD